MRAGARVAAALVVLLGICPAARAAGPEKPASSADSERQADLRRLRSRIGSLEAQLAQSRRRQATLSEELSRLELQLAIAAGEKELLARLREDYGARLGEIAVERKSAEVAGERSRRALQLRKGLHVRSVVVHEEPVGQRTVVHEPTEQNSAIRKPGRCGLRAVWS